MVTKKNPTRKQKAIPDAIELLMQDHVKVRKLLDQLEKANAPSRREELFKEIELELKIHTKIEEEIFYPAYEHAVKKKSDKKIYFEAVEEHHVVDLILPEIDHTNAKTDEFAAKAKVLKDLVEHHIMEEETEMFPISVEVLSQEELQELGVRLYNRKNELKEKMGKK